MTVSELRELSNKDIMAKLAEMQREQFKIKVAHSTGQSVKSHLIREVRHNIARIKTVMNEQRVEN